MRTVEKLSLQMRPPSTRALLAGWRMSAELLTARPFRRHIIRPALQGEISDRNVRSFPPAIVCIRRPWPEPFALEQLVLVFDNDRAVDPWRDDRGEVAARDAFEDGEHYYGLQRCELITFESGEPRIMGLRVLYGAEPNAAWVVAHWHRPEERVDPAWLQRAGARTAA